MSSFFSTTFLNALKVGGTTSMTGVTVRMYVYPNAPLFENNDARYTGISTISTLSSTLGWGQYISAIPAAVAVILNTVGTTNYVIQTSTFDLPGNFPPTKVAALAFVYQSGPDAAMVGRLMFVTNTLFVEENIILYNQDGITPSPDTTHIVGSNNRWLMQWSIPTAGQINATEGEIVIEKGTPPFEAARTQHVWMYPQRVNMVANPSFEAVDTHWKHSGTLTRVSGGIESAWYGHCAGSPKIIMESNTFPTKIRKDWGSGWTIQLTARGDGELKVGLVSWPAEYDSTATDWGPVEETWNLSSGNWITIRTLRSVYDVSSALLRLELDGTFLDIDHVSCEPGWMPANGSDWPYFDGSSTYGALDDYSWYGNRERTAGTPTREHQTYSCWYNHRRAITGRLFQWALNDEGPGSVFTDEEVAAQGMVYSWVPAGTPVQQHLDVLYPEDPQSAVADVSGSLTPREVGTPGTVGYTHGVTNPW